VENVRFSGFFPLLDSSQKKNMDDKKYEHRVLESNTEYYIAYHFISDAKKKNLASWNRTPVTKIEDCKQWAYSCIRAGDVPLLYTIVLCTQVSTSKKFCVTAKWLYYGFSQSSEKLILEKLWGQQQSPFCHLFRKSCAWYCVRYIY